MDAARRFFLVGIGGAGMSALARMLHERGLPVAGADLVGGPEVDGLRSLGIEVHTGHAAEPVRAFATGPTALVLSDAIDLATSPEVAAARELAVPIFRRSQLLGWLLRDRKVLAVTGTHGKTTTTGMVGMGLEAVGLDPLVIVGAEIPQWGSPVREGKGEWAVVEACEAYDSFHDLDPQIVLLTNLEPDHLDFHGDWTGLRGSVVRFVDRLPADGALVYCAADPGATEIAQGAASRTVPYGSAEFPLAIPGAHNAANAAGALAAIIETGVADLDRVREGIARFTGADRRLQVVREGEIAIVDDYAHHPTEIAASIEALRAKYQGRRLVVVFQPHLYSRTKDQLAGFGEALSAADVVVLTDIYPAREDPIPGVSSAVVAELVKRPCHYVPSRHLLPRKVAQLVRSGDVVVGMGAGTIGQFARAFAAELDRAQRSPKRIAVAYGGDSSEREVSILSGRAIHAALRRKGYDADFVDLTELLLTGKSLDKFIGPDRYDAVFLAVHGTNSEDGAMQGFLELLHMPYTGSGVQASAIAMDKAATKQILERHGIRTPRGGLVRSATDPLPVAPPLIVKPNAEGSTVGLSFVETEDQIPAALQRALAYGDALVEEWVRGMEVSTPVLIDRALPTVEIAPAGGRYDFAAKYTQGATEEIVPARLPEDVLRRTGEIALAAHRALGCRGATRTDAIVTSDGEVIVLEVNTLPGMTGTSLLPNSAQAAGIPFDDLCETILEEALARNGAQA